MKSADDRTVTKGYESEECHATMTLLLDRGADVNASPLRRKKLPKDNTPASFPKWMRGHGLMARLLVGALFIPAANGRAQTPESFDYVLSSSGGLVFWLGFSPDGKTLASANCNEACVRDYNLGAPMTIRLWDLETRTDKGALAAVEQGWPSARSLAFAPSGKSVVSALDHKTLWSYDVTSQKSTALLEFSKSPFDTQGAALSVNDRSVAFLASFIYEGRLWVLDSESGKEARRISSKNCHSFDIGLSPDGSGIAIAGTDYPPNQSFVLDVKAGPRKFNCKNLSPSTALALPEETHVGASLHSIAYSPDGKLIGALRGYSDDSGEQRIVLFDTTWGKVVGEWPARLGHTWSKVVFSPDGTTLAAFGMGRSDVAEFINASSKQKIPSPLEGTIGALAFSPDKKTFAYSIGHDIHVATVDKIGYQKPRELRADLGEALAAAVRRVDSIKVNELLDQGADPIAGMGAAVNRESPEMVALLLDRGADVNAWPLGQAKQPTNSTPLMWATANHDVGTVKVLIEHGAQVDAQDDRGDTALMYFSKAHDDLWTGVISLLLAHGADPGLRNRAGKTAFNLYKETLGVQKALDLVRALGGKIASDQEIAEAKEELSRKERQEAEELRQKEEEQRRALLEQQQEQERAAAAVERAVNACPDEAARGPLPESSVKLLIQAKAFAGQRKYDKARDAFRQVIFQSPGNANARYNLALLEALGFQDYPTAVAQMKCYLQLSPDASDASNVRHRIYDWEARIH